SFDVDLDERFGAKRAHDHIARNALQSIRIHTVPPRHLPDQAVIEAHLLDLAGADAVGATIANVTDPRTFRPQQARGRRRTHAAKLRVLLSLGVDGGISFNKRLAQRRDAVLGSLLVVGVGDDADGQ